MSTYISRIVEKSVPVETRSSTRNVLSVERSNRGNVSISDTCPDGKFIELENQSHSQEENLGGWKIKRSADGQQHDFTFPNGFVLRPGRKVKVWARGQGGHHFPPDELVADYESTWGTGSHIRTTLHSQQGEERASCVESKAS
ncbi:Intermediate filament protein A [Aphelenchoides avenae]|nr:Intermediate filament protein A [Aphelenchus avenae]